MDSMSYRNNRPSSPRTEREEAAASQPASVASAAPASHSSGRSQRSHGGHKRRPVVPIVIAVILLIAALIGGWFLFNRTSTSAAIDDGKYQAVFFTNGQVYFGKLSELNGDYMRLKGVYYLQNKEQAEDDTSPQSASKQDASDVELIKLGNEIHGPEDEMLVAKNQILFFENLKPAGTVSQTITNFQSKK